MTSPDACSGPISGPDAPTCYVEYETSYAYHEKCGFNDNCALDEWPELVFCHYTHHISLTYSGSDAGTNGYTPPWDFGWSGCNISPGDYSGSWSYSEDVTGQLFRDRTNCLDFVLNTGSESYMNQAVDSRVYYCDNPETGCYTSRNYQSNYFTYNQTVIGTNNGDHVVWYWSRQDNQAGQANVTDADCGVATGLQSYSTNQTYFVGFEMPPSLSQVVYTSSNCTYQAYQLDPASAPPSFSGTESFLVDDEYTDGDLWNVIFGQLPAYPGVFTPPQYVVDEIAYSFLDNAHDHGELQKMKFRFAVQNTKGGNMYHVTWEVITWDVSAGLVSGSTMQAYVAGNGDPSQPVYTGEYEVPAPYWTVSPYGGLVVSWLAGVGVAPGGSISPPGSGPYSGGSAVGNGCRTCGGSPSTSLLGTGKVAGISAEFGLGLTTLGNPVGSLSLSADKPSTQLSTPASLSLAATPDVQAVLVSNQIRQLKAPQTFVDVITDDAFTYELRFYLPSQFSSATNGSGLYTPLGSPAPFVTWTIQNPDASTNTFNRLFITETRGADVKTYQYTYSNGSWTAESPGGLREEVATCVITTNAPGTSAYDGISGQNYYRIVTTTVRPPGGSDQVKVQRTFQKFTGRNDPGRDAGFEVLIQEVLSPDTNPKTNTYNYAESLYCTNATFRPLQSVQHPDGSWEYYDYLQDGSGRLYHVYSGFGDQALPTSGPPDTNQCRYTSYDYTPLTAADDGTLFPNSPRTATSYLQGQITSKSFRVVQLGEVDDIRCQHPDAPWNDTNNLVTVTKYFTSGTNLNRVQSVLSPDGTLVIYDYAQAADGSQTNIIYSGQPDATNSTIIDGTKDVAVLGPVGQMISHTVTDIASSGAILQRDIYGNYDSFSRPQQVTHLDGTTETLAYTCCGLDNMTDRDGVPTFYSYDLMKRQTATSRLNITTSSVLDAGSRVLQTIRTGSDNSPIVLAQAQYDLAGRLVGETNALGGVTSYAETTGTGGLIRTATYPDGGTRVESYYLDGSLKQVSGTAVHPVQYLYGIDADGPYTTEIKLTATGGTNEWTKTSTDLLGRTYKTVYADGASSQSIYNGLGQLASEVDPDGVTTLYQYNGKGEVAYTAVDTNRNGTIDFAGADRITSTLSDVTTDHGVSVRRTRTYVWDTLNANSSDLVSVSESSTDGLRSWQTTYRDPGTAVMSSSQTTFGTGGSRSVSTFAPDNSYSISLYSYGQLASVTRYDSLGSQLSSVAYSYDPHGRQSTLTDGRNGPTSFTYNNADLATTVTTPDPQVAGGSRQTTWTYYNKMLQATNIVNPDLTGVTNSYLPTGELGQTSGSRTYPVAYTYDYAGRMKTMQTWQAFPTSGSAVTTWNYDPYRGFLTNKASADGQGPSYAYTPGGRLQTRVWARGVTTTYTCDNGGLLASIGYSDSTPQVTYTYDRLGRQSTVSQNGTATTTLSYNLAGEVLSESYSGGTFGGLSLTNGYDLLMRRTNLTALNSTTPLLKDAYGYDNASRLQTVTDNSGATAYSASYTYLPKSPFIGQITFQQGATTRMTTTKQYDLLNRLTQISSAPSGSSALSFGYSYNNANQRIVSRLPDGSYWRYQYDSLGQVTGGHKFFADQTSVPGQQFDYAFDTIGNRTQTKAGGDAAGANQRSANYYANILNEYTNRDVPGAVDIMGVSFTTNAVTVNSQAAWRKGEYFRQQLSVGNTSSAQWTNVTVSATGQPSQSGNQFVAKTQEAFGYDYDGNLTNDGRWAYSWDAENRLVQLVPNTTNGPQQLIKFEYDSKGRRVHKQVWPNTAGTGSATNDLKFVYDGWNLVAELSSLNSAVRTYLWGLDLSGSPQGAGGVGGLLEVVYYGSTPTNCFPAFDGNGNMAALISASGGTNAATYEYGPFGEVIRATGPMAKANPLRFSTKYQDDETDLLYYGYRYYGPGMGRWLSRDLIEEGGGLNLYALDGNDFVQRSDALGLKTYQAANATWSAANMWTSKVWSRCGCPSGLVDIGDIGIPYAWIDATPNASLLTAQPAVWSWIIANYSAHIGPGSMKLLTNPAYVGAGAAFQFSPGPLANTCCEEVSWKQEIKGWFGHWSQDGPIIRGNLYVDSPGGYDWQFPWTRGREFRLHLRCNGHTVSSVHWSYSVSPSGGFKVTLQLPP